MTLEKCAQAPSNSLPPQRTPTDISPRNRSPQSRGPCPHPRGHGRALRAPASTQRRRAGAASHSKGTRLAAPHRQKKKETKRTQKSRLANPKTRFAAQNEPKSNPRQTPIQPERTHLRRACAAPASKLPGSTHCNGGHASAQRTRPTPQPHGLRLMARI